MNRSIQNLESRQMLAAAAYITSQGVLTIAGTNDIDNVVVQGGTTNGRFTVRIDMNNDGDVIDGIDASLTFNNVRAITANMKGGNDNLLITDPNFSGNISVNMGSGNDKVAIGDLSFNYDVFGNISMIGGSGDDTIALESDVFGSVTVNAGSGNDYLEAGRLTIVTISGSASVNCGSGNDRVRFDDVECSRKLVNGAGGFDNFSSFYSQNIIQSEINSGRLSLQSFENFSYNQPL